MRKLGTQGLEVAGLGYGAMGLTAFYGEPVSDEHGIAIMKRAVELGVTMLDTAEVYRSAFDGTGKLNEELVLRGKIKRFEIVADIDFVSAF